MKRLLATILVLTLLAMSCAALAEDAPTQTVDAQALRKQALDAGMKLPEPGEGEALYLGVGDVNFTRQTRLFLAFIAAPNGKSIRAAVLFGQAIEVPRDGQDPWLINNQLALVEDYWIPLDMGGPTDIVIDEEYYTAIAMLTVDAEGGSCSLVMSGHYDSADADDDWNATARIKLVNLTGKTAMDPIDPPTRRQAIDAGMTLPEAGAGETLYLGAANVSQAGAFYVAFVLSEDGTSVKGLTVFARDLALEYRLGVSRVTTTSSTYATAINAPLEMAEEVAAGAIRLTHFALEGDGAAGLLDYSYHSDNDNLNYPLDPAWVRFQRAE